MPETRAAAAHPRPPAPARAVLLYDGTCGLCAACIRLLRRLDAGGRLVCLPLQHPRALAWLRAQGLPTEDFSTLVFVPDWRAPPPAPHLVRSDAVLAACAVTGGFGRELANLRALPRGPRDALYRLVARTRHRWLGPVHPPAPADVPEECQPRDGTSPTTGCD